MFTGLVTAIGEVRQARGVGAGRELEVAAPWTDLVVGESIAVDGACLTVETVTRAGFTVHLVTTTLDRTKFGATVVGDQCNLERALQAGSRLGGHLVQGHVDGVGEVVRVAGHGDARLVDIAVPPVVAEASIPLGSVTVDGVSLTINAMPERGVIQVSLIPFTLQHTTLGARQAGDQVHLEGDAVGKYVRAMLQPHLGMKAD